MRILVPIPSFEPHGGIRVMVEIINGLARRGHVVYVFPVAKLGNKNSWTWDNRVKFVYLVPPNLNAILITSPHSMHFFKPKKTVLHMQMLEHMFCPEDVHWYKRCKQFYEADAPLLTISDWNRRELIEIFGRDPNRTHYIGNGVSFADFPIEEFPDKEPNTILVEGWVNYNPCKDVKRLAPKVAARLKEDGYKIISYGLLPISDYADIVDEYYIKPNLTKLNDLYRRATICVKASLYDARSCSPVEAMTKGTPTVRAIVEGDDDLIDQYNCLRVPYCEDALYEGACRLLNDPALYRSLQENGYSYLRSFCDWEFWITAIENHLKEIK